jgi:hypothetical protein
MLIWSIALLGVYLLRGTGHRRFSAAQICLGRIGSGERHFVAVGADPESYGKGGSAARSP